MENKMDNDRKVKDSKPESKSSTIDLSRKDYHFESTALTPTTQSLKPTTQNEKLSTKLSFDVGTTSKMANSTKAPGNLKQVLRML